MKNHVTFFAELLLTGLLSGVAVRWNQSSSGEGHPTYLKVDYDVFAHRGEMKMADINEGGRPDIVTGMF